MEEDLEDINEAKHILAENNPTWTQEEIEREFGLLYPY